MPPDSDTATRPPGDRDLEARLRAELGVGAVPPRERERHLAALHDLTVAQGSTRADTAGADHVAQRTATASGHSPGTARSRTRSAAPGTRHAARRAPAPLRSRLAAAVLMLLVVVTAGSGITVAAAQDALPGDMLYPVKLAAERVTLVTAGGDSERVEHHLDLAERRIDEAAGLVAGDGDLDGLASVLARHLAELDAAEASAGTDPALQDAVDAALGTSAERLAALTGTVPEEVAPGAERALERAQERIEDRGADDGAPAADGHETGPGAAPPERAPGAPPDPTGETEPDGTDAPERDAPDAVPSDDGADEAPDAGEDPDPTSPTYDTPADPGDEDGDRPDADDDAPDDAGNAGADDAAPDSQGDERDAGETDDGGAADEADAADNAGETDDGGAADDADGESEASDDTEPGGTDHTGASAAPGDSTSDEGDDRDTGDPDAEGAEGGNQP